MRILIVDALPILHKTYRFDPNYLATKGHKVTVICPKPIDLKKAIEAHGAAEFIFIPTWKPAENNFDLLNRINQLVFMIIRIKKCLRTENYDVICAPGFLPTYASITARGNHSIPIVGILTDFYSELYTQFGLFFSSGMKNILYKIEQKIASSVDLLFVDTPTQRNYWRLYGLNEKKCIVMPHGFEKNLRQQIADTSNVRDKYKIGSNTKIIFYCGDISRIDGLDILIAAAPAIINKIEDIKFLIVGTGSSSYLNQIKKEIKKRNLEEYVIFTGYLSYDLMPEHLAIADVCVAPFVLTKTSNSAQCLKILAYTIMKKPTVATSASGIQELFGDILNYVPPENPTELAKALVGVLKQGPLNQEIIERIDILSNKFEWETIWKEQEEILYTLVNNSTDDYRTFDFF